MVITPDSTVFDAIKVMSDCKVGALVVTDPLSKRPLGVISERDYLNKVVLKGLSSKSTQVKGILFVVGASVSLIEAIYHDIRHHYYSCQRICIKVYGHDDQRKI